MNESNGNGEIETILRKAADGTIPPDVESRMDFRLEALRDRLDEYEPAARSCKARSFLRVFRTSGPRNARWAMASAAAVLAMALVVVLYPWRDSYAAALDQLRNARSLTFVYSGDQSPESGDIEVAYRAPGQYRFNLPSGSYLVVDFPRSKAIWVSPSQKAYREYDRFLRAHPYAHSFIDELRSLPDKPDENLGTKEIDGRVVKGYRVTRNQPSRTVDVWIDAETNKPVRFKDRREEEKKGRGAPPVRSGPDTVEHILGMFNLDATPDDALFDLTPPPGFSPAQSPSESGDAR